MADPITGIQVTQPQQGNTATAAQIKSLRDMVNALQNQKPGVGYGTLGGLGQGLSNFSDKVVAGLFSREADQMEGRRARAAAEGDIPEAPSTPGGGADNRPFYPVTGEAPEGGGTPDDMVEHIKKFEGYKAKPYDDGKQVSIGYGSKARQGETYLSREDAEARLQKDLDTAAAQVDKFHPDLPPQARNALTDLTYNTGTKWQTAGLGRAVQNEDWDTAKKLFLQYNKANGQELPGLVARRQAFANAFNAPAGAPVPPAVAGPAPGGSSPPAPAGASSIWPQPKIPYSNPTNSPDLDFTKSMVNSVRPTPPAPAMEFNAQPTGARTIDPSRPVGDPNNPPNLPQNQRLAQAGPPQNNAPQGAPGARNVLGMPGYTTGPNGGEIIPPQQNLLQPQVAPRDRPFVPWQTIPRPAPISRDAAMRAYMAAEGPAEKQRISERYMQQFQPVEVPMGNGKVIVNFQNGTQTYIHQPKDTTFKVGGMEVPGKIYTNPHTGEDIPRLLTPGGGQGPAQAQPQAPTQPQAPRAPQFNTRWRQPAAQPPAPGSGPQPNETKESFIARTPSVYPKIPLGSNDLNQYRQAESAIKAYDESAKSFQEKRDEIAKGAYNDANDLGNLKLLENVLQDPRIASGVLNKTITSWDDAFRVFGLSKGQTASLSALADKLGSGEMAADIRNANITQGVAVRNIEADAFRKGNFDLNKPLGANLAVTRLAILAKERGVDYGQFADAYTRKHGRLDNGFYDARDSWYSKHPVISEEQRQNFDKLIAAPGETGESPKPKYSKEEYEAEMRRRGLLK